MSTRPATSSSSATAAPVTDSPDRIRNVVLVGHSGAGKTTLFEHLVAATTPGYRPKPVGEARSVSLTVASVTTGGVVVNLVDTPGYPDFGGELRAGLRAADAALFVVSAADGVDAAVAMLWQECAAVGMPRAVAVTKLDAARADFEDTVAICQRVFGDEGADVVLPLYLPLHGEDESIAANLGLLSQQIYDYSSGVRVVRDAEDRHRELIEGARAELVEAIIQESEDDTLLDRYLEGEEVGMDILAPDLLTAVSRGRFHPVLPVSAETGTGIQELLYLFEAGFPSPAQHPLPTATRPDGRPLPPLRCEPGDPLVAEVVRTTSDPYVGRVSLLRVFSGTLRPDSVVHVSGHLSHAARATSVDDVSGAGTTDLTTETTDEAHRDCEERIGLLASPLNDALRPRGPAVAGDLVAVAKLAHAETSDTLSDPSSPALVEPWVLPEALLPVAIRASSNADEDKLAGALQRLVAEDPTMRLEHNPTTHQVVLWAMGEAHVEVLLGRLRDRYAVSVEAEPLKVALRETFVEATTGHGRHVKQSGGHGQYAVADVEVIPLERGAGIVFVDRVVGGAVPRQFIASVEKGVRVQAERGCLAGYPLIDVQVTLVGGKAHAVDSSDMAFQTAGALALRDAASPTTVTLLEPVDAVRVLVADEYVGAVLTDLRSRRARVLGTEPGDASESGRTTVLAEVPQTELPRYPIDLRSVSHGTGSFTRHPLRYEPMPPALVRAALDGVG